MAEVNNPEGVHAPVGAYHHCAILPPGARVLTTAGQVGAAPDGTLAAGFRAQAEQAFRNVLTCVEANGFEARDLVKLVIYILDRDHLAEMRAARIAVLGEDVQPPSTLLIISGLASPDMLIEVEATAARAP